MKGRNNFFNEFKSQVLLIAITGILNVPIVTKYYPFSCSIFTFSEKIFSIGTFDVMKVAILIRPSVIFDSLGTPRIELPILT